MTDLVEFLDFAVRTATRAGEITLQHFQRSPAAELKDDGSPVTIADRAAERLIREAIADRYPDHAVVGEEFGADARQSRYRWYIDPIDGTRNYVRGVPLYGVLIGLEADGELVVGVAHFPALGETVSAARGHGCRWNDRMAQVSKTDRLEDACLVYTDAAQVRERLGERWTALERGTALQRGWGDCYGHCLVATGRADAMLDPRMNPWDCAALVPILLEAGGTFTDWRGRTTIHGGDAVSTNGALAGEVLSYLHA